jgi:glycosyl hydrolase family 99
MKEIFPKTWNPLQSQMRSTILGLWFIFTALFLLVSCTAAPGSVSAQQSDPIPVLAYYYIWFDTTSWDRAKIDYPVLGHYSSDNAQVMRQHIKWAKTAGINGFIVSWKSTEKLNRRLEQLIEIADQEDFKLVIIYQGLDFHREPLPVAQIEADFSYFMDHFAERPTFDLYERPVVIWSGTWRFSREEVESVIQDKRDHLLILASERNVEGYQNLADLVDGNAYYWSSVNPDTFPGYEEKLAEMGAAIHANGGLWIAPVAAGFDARLIGGTTVVERNDGQTLQIQFNVAMQSMPDAIGLISWNEFSENSHIEPSENYDQRYLKVLADIRHARVPAISDFDSSDPGDTFSRLGTSRVAALGLVGALVIYSMVLIFRRAVR